MRRPQFKNPWFLWLRHTECACYFLQIPYSYSSQSRAKLLPRLGAFFFAFDFVVKGALLS